MSRVIRDWFRSLMDVRRGEWRPDPRRGSPSACSLGILGCTLSLGNGPMWP